MFSSKAKHEYFEYHESKKDLSAGKLDPMEPLEECQGCGRKIYPGEEVYVINGYILHAEVSCLLDFLSVMPMPIEEALGVK